jgi:TolB protein
MPGLAALCVASGCSLRRPRTDEATNEATSVILAAARAQQIRMFGDFPGSPAPEYVSRTLMSLRQHTFADVGGDFDVDVSSTGERLIFASTRHHTQADLYLKAVNGVAVTQLTSDPASDIQPAFSPGDTQVAFASNRGGDWDIWIINTDGGPPIQITSGPADDLHPSWSPDGSQLVYCSLPPGGGQWELWIADANTGASRRFIGYGLFPDWAPAGDGIVYQRARERGSRWFSIWSLRLVNGEPRYPTELASAASRAMILPTFSHDGGSIAYVSVPLQTEMVARERGVQEGPWISGAAPYDIWVMQADGRGKIRLTDGQTMNHGPAFGPDGRLYFTCNRSGHENIWSLAPGGASLPGASAASEPEPVSGATTLSGSDGGSGRVQNDL